MKSIYLRGKFLISLRNNYNLVQQMDYNVIIVPDFRIQHLNIVIVLKKAA